ncbi:cation:proton antiporter, partial [Paracoccus sp. (in: a-proteobacteria)]|uniref:cation:proton antiporter domain-containing protein n=1 Tax=Paracoccus sp. TaxID=267 RepID=UPI00396CCA17
MNDINTILALLCGVTIALAWVRLAVAQSVSSDAPCPDHQSSGRTRNPWLIDRELIGDRAPLMEKAARLLWGIGLFGVALRIPASYLRRSWKELLVLVGVSMVLMWAVSTALVFLILGLLFWVAAWVGAIITPTDPVAASPIVTEQEAENNIPGNLRHAISFESGANDGLAYLFVFLPFLLLTKPTGEAQIHWLGKSVLWDVGAATLVDAAIGFAAARLLRTAERHGAITSEWRLVYTVALAACDGSGSAHQDGVVAELRPAGGYGRSGRQGKRPGMSQPGA